MKDENKVDKGKNRAGEAAQQKKTQKAKKRKQEEHQRDGKKFISGVRLLCGSSCHCHSDRST